MPKKPPKGWMLFDGDKAEYLVLHLITLLQSRSSVATQADFGGIAISVTRCAYCGGLNEEHNEGCPLVYGLEQAQAYFDRKKEK